METAHTSLSQRPEPIPMVYGSMSIRSEEVNYLIYRYLQECGSMRLDGAEA